jgi:hypothetical protein
VPDVFFMEKDKYGNEIKKVGRHFSLSKFSFLDPGEPHSQQKSINHIKRNGEHILT